MDVATFVDQTLNGLAAIPRIVDSMVATEGPIVDGYGIVSDSLYLHFYFNEQTGTTAFALIHANHRVWGIDYDQRRGWHLHPLGATHSHEPICPKTTGEIITLFSAALEIVLRS